MKLIRSFMGRRQFLFSAGAASASALFVKKLAGLLDPFSKPGVAEAAIKKNDTKCVVVYSSMTGNTEKAARAIQKGLAEASGACDIFSVKDADPHKLAGYDFIAFGYPLMGPALKLDVDTFLTNLRYVGGLHIVLFSTSDSASNNHAKCLPLLKKHGLITLGSRSWHGAVYGPLGDPTPGRGDGHPDKTDLADAANWAKEKWELSKKIYAGDTSLIPAAPTQTGERGKDGGPGGPPGGTGGAPGAAGGAAGGPPAGAPGGAGGRQGGIPEELVGLENDTPEQLKKRIHFELVYNKDKCMFPTCTRCMDICPVNGIDYTVEPRVYGDPCMMCAMCDQVCPTGAIYVDPKHMEWQRRVEGYADNVVQVYQAYPKHPRFIVGYGRPYGYDPYTKEDRGDGSKMGIDKKQES